MSTTIERYTFLPKTWEEAIEFAKTISKSSLCPKNYRHKPEDIFMAMQIGLEIGLTPLQALHTINIINGQPCLCSDDALSLVKASGELESIEENVEGDCEEDAVATCAIKRKGSKKLLKHHFGVQEAKEKGLWHEIASHENPQRELALHARALSLQEGFADILKGLKILTTVPSESAEHQSSIPVSLGKNYSPSWSEETPSTVHPLTQEPLPSLDESKEISTDLDDNDPKESDVERELAQREALQDMRAENTVTDMQPKKINPELEMQIETAEKLDKLMEGLNKMKFTLLKWAISLILVITGSEAFILKFFE